MGWGGFVACTCFCVLYHLFDPHTTPHAPLPCWPAADPPQGYRAYYEQLLRLVRPGGVIAIDNVLWYGRVAHPEQASVVCAWLAGLSGPQGCLPRLASAWGCARAAAAALPALCCISSPTTLPLTWPSRPPALGLQADKNTAALIELNDFLLSDERVSFSLVAVGDGMALCTKR